MDDTFWASEGTILYHLTKAGTPLTSYQLNAPLNGIAQDLDGTLWISSGGINFLRVSRTGSILDTTQVMGFDQRITAMEIDVSTVPEPASMIAFGAGLACVVLRKRRRHNS